MAVPAARFASPTRWSRTVAQTAFACAASLALHALALGGLAWLYRSSALREAARLEVRIASVYLAPVAPPLAEPLSPPRTASAPPIVDALPSPPADLPSRPFVPDGLAHPLAPERASERIEPSDAEPAASLPRPPATAPSPQPVPRALPRAVSNDARVASAAAVEWRVQDWLAQHRHYPRAARRSGAEGTVWVRFVLDRGGALHGSEILASSGHAVLDRAALDLLRRATPFPALPPDLAMDEIELVLPIEYDLTRAARG
jgi:protein TonB